MKTIRIIKDILSFLVSVYALVNLGRGMLERLNDRRAIKEQKALYDEWAAKNEVQLSGKVQHILRFGDDLPICKAPTENANFVRHLDATSDLPACEKCQATLRKWNEMPL